MASNGSDVLFALGTRYRNIGDVELRVKVQVAIDLSLRKTEYEIRLAALRMLPKRGGVAAWVSNAPIKIRTATNTAGRKGMLPHSFGAWIIQGYGGTHDFRALNYGRLRHPTFGRRDNTQDWHTQEIPKGYFSGTIIKDLPRIMRKLEEAAFSVLE
jgi:hypothetical protein